MLFSRQRAAVIKRREQKEHAAVSRSVRPQRSGLLRLFLQPGGHMTPLGVSSGLNWSWQPDRGTIVARNASVLPLDGSVVLFGPLGSNWNPPQLLPYWTLDHDDKSLFCLLFVFVVFFLLIRKYFFKAAGKFYSDVKLTPNWM